MAIVLIADCPLCGHQAQAWTNASGVWVACSALDCPMPTAIRLEAWNGLSQLRRDRHTALRSLAQAVQCEREACAQLAESFIPSGFVGPFGTARDDRARVIARAIRNRRHTR